MIQLIVILGPTATGKTRLASKLAAETGGEVISADSRQVYRGMDIGTGKDLDDYIVDGKAVPYHLVDIVDPGYEYNVYEFQKDVEKCLRSIDERGNTPILCGGTGMYIDAVINAYQFQAVPRNELLRDELDMLSMDELVERLKSYGALHNVTDTTHRHRTIRAIEIREFEKAKGAAANLMPNFSEMVFGVHFEREDVRQRITDRLEKRLDEGLIQEVAGLLEKGMAPGQLIFYGLEYKYVTRHILGELTFDEMFGLLNTAIHQFAKRQMTWFRRMERKGTRIQWINGTLPLSEKVRVIKSHMKH